MNLKKKFVIGAASLALVAGMGVAPAMAVNTKTTGDEVRFPDGGSFTRVFGDSRFDTALAVAEQLYKDSNKSLKVAYLVSSDNAAMVDAATSGMLKDGVVLLVSKDKAQQLLLGATIKDKFPTVRKLVAVGGTATVSDEAVANVKKMNDKVTSTDRLGGKNRYETNVAVAKAAYKNNVGISEVHLTRGDMMVDALTAGAVADGPVLLVNRQGDVDPATVKYFQSISNHSTVILGGEASLSDEQVGKLFKNKEVTDAWTFLKSTAQLKANVQEAAATYYGQSIWQQQGNGTIGKTALPPTLADFKESKLDDYNFFGLRHASGVNSESKNPSDIKIDQVVTTPANKVFVGYKTPNELLASNMLIVKNHRETLNTATENALRAVKALNAGNDSAKHVKAAGLTSKPSSGAAKTLWEAVQAQYGLTDAAIATAMSGTSISEEGAWAFDDEGKLTGLNESRLKDIEAKLADGGDWGTEKVYTNNTKQMTLSDIIYSTIASDTSKIKGQKTAKADVFAASAATDSVDWEALYNGLKAEYEKQSAATAAAKQALIDAVRAYYNAADYKITTDKNGGIPRLAGADRYETSALLAVYELRDVSTDSWVHQAKVDPEFGRAYLASGDDARLIDSVVAGQLTDGPILLAPSTGEMNKYVLEHLAYLKNKVSNLGTYLIGGKVAVSDEVRDAAVKALKNSKSYAGTTNWVDNTPAAPAVSNFTVNPTTVTMNASDVASAPVVKDFTGALSDGSTFKATVAGGSANLALSNIKKGGTADSTGFTIVEDTGADATDAKFGIKIPSGTAAGTYTMDVKCTDATGTKTVNITIKLN